MIGQRLGHYEILSRLGAGGMGEVYRARDSKLDRDVALKILPDAFASDPERRARFVREAKTLAALNHPHVAHIYGVEESATTSALVMELVEGEDLSARIARGPLAFDEAVAIAKQITQALESAHEQGIIHRDLKPANIKLRDDGTIKVLDFGLAKALEPASARGDSAAPELANSPTITSPAGATLGGVILGTAAYMAPEQAKGRSVDKRADIWAFGCVFYEMLTGRRAFAGEDVSDTLAAVLKAEVDWSGVPRQAIRLLKRCLERDPRRRLHDIADAWDLVDESAPATSAADRRMPWLPWAVAGALLVASVALAVPYFATVPTPFSVRFQVEAPPNTELGPYFSLSPDGRRLAFTAVDDKRTTHLWVRSLESLDAVKVQDSEGARSLFWSPDSRHVAFTAGTSLKRVDVTGGLPQSVATVPLNAGAGDWHPNGVMLIGSRGGGPIQRVSASGGTPVDVTELDTAGREIAHAFPRFLPDGRRFLYFKQSAARDLMGIYLASLDVQPSQQPADLLVETSSGPYFVASSRDGLRTRHRLLFAKESALMAQMFDPGRGQILGDAMTIAERLGTSGAMTFFAASDDVLAIRTGQRSTPNNFQPAWVDRNGQTIETIGEPGPYGTGPYAIALSPGGRHAAAVMTSAGTSETDLWVLDLARGVRNRFTYSNGSQGSPRWSGDGTRIAFRSSGANSAGVFEKALDGAAETALIDTMRFVTPTDWSSDGKFLLYGVRPNNVPPDDMAILSIESGQSTTLIESPFAELAARFSPDARWIAYESDESGEREIYVRPLTVLPHGKPTVGPATRISTKGGTQVRWRGDGRELFYRDASGAIVSVDVTTNGRSLDVGLPKRLFSPTAGAGSWDVTRDGQRFLLLVPVEDLSADPITVIVNWSATKDPEH
jgi:Tol biopolymer transport system component